jgi:hypothetical protein
MDPSLTVADFAHTKFFVHPSSHRLDRTQKFLLTLSFAHTLVDLKISTNVWFAYDVS